MRTLDALFALMPNTLASRMWVLDFVGCCLLRRVFMRLPAWGVLGALYRMMATLNIGGKRVIRRSAAVVYSSAGAAFDAVAASYDEERRMLVPCFDAFYGNALELVGSAMRPEASVLDLGAGTGLLSALIAAQHPDARFHLIDLSDRMLDEARRRFSVFRGASMTSEVADLSTVELPGCWDVVVSALAIHHLDHAAKQRLFAKVFDALAPGGLFVNAEQVLGPSRELEAEYERIWLAQVRAAGASELQIELAAGRMRFDRCATVHEHLEWLREAGFSPVDCTFKSWRFAVIAGWKDRTAPTGME